MKTCVKCSQVKSLDEFKANRTTKDGKNRMCKSCVLEYRREYNRTEKGRMAQKRMRIKQRYGLTYEQYEELSVAHGNCCAVCKENPDEILNIDHCHETGRVRGLLCRSCNIGLGNFRDSPALLHSALDYLAR